MTIIFCYCCRLTLINLVLILTVLGTLINHLYLVMQCVGGGGALRRGGEHREVGREGGRGFKKRWGTQGGREGGREGH